MISVVITCYQRFQDFNDILSAWQAEKLVNDILVVDNSGHFYHDSMATGWPVRVINIRDNMGTQAKYPIALLAQNEWVIFADDDILPKPGLAEDLFVHRALGFVGIIGRIFNGKSYYTSQGLRGENIDRPIEVDWLGGGCTLAPRWAGMVETAHCPANEVDDWWWEDNFPQVEKFVIPTKKYKFINPQEGIHTTPACKEWREKYYAQTQSRLG